MDIEQIRVAKREMEDAIRSAVDEAMATFHAKTSMFPQSVYVRLAEVTTVDGRERRYVVNEVRADIQL